MEFQRTRWLTALLYKQTKNVTAQCSRASWARNGNDERDPSERSVKTKFLFWVVLFFLSGCSLFWTPTATTKKFIAGAEKGDVGTMTSLFSSKAIEQLGSGKIRSNNQNLSAVAGRVRRSCSQREVYPDQAERAARQSFGSNQLQLRG